MLAVTSFEYPSASWSIQVPPFPLLTRHSRGLVVPILPLPFFHAFTILLSFSYQTTLFAFSTLPLIAGPGSGSWSSSPSPRANYSDDKTVPSTTTSLPSHTSHPALSSRRGPAYYIEFSASTPPSEPYARELFAPLHSFSFGSWVVSRSNAPCCVYAGTRYHPPSSASVQFSWRHDSPPT